MENMEKEPWIKAIPDDGRDFIIHGRNKGDQEYWPMDIDKPAFVGEVKEATPLKKEKLAEILPLMREQWTELDWVVKDRDGNAYLDSIRLDGQDRQEAGQQKPQAYPWPEGGKFHAVDEKAMQSALGVGIEVSTRDFAVGLPPTDRRIAIGLAAAIVNPQLDRDGLARMLRDNGYGFDDKAVNALWSVRSQHRDGMLDLNEIVGAIEHSIPSIRPQEETIAVSATATDTDMEADVTYEEEERTPFQQIKDAVDLTLKGESHGADIWGLANRLTDSQLTAAVDYSLRYKGRKKIVKAGLEQIRRQVMNVIDERYNARHPAEAEQEAYDKTKKYLEQGKGDESFSIDEYIRSHERERDEARSKGLTGQAAVQQGVVRASRETRDRWRSEQQNGRQQDTSARMEGADGKNHSLVDLVAWIEKSTEDGQGLDIREFRRLVQEVDDVRLNLIISYAESARDKLGKNPEQYNLVMDTLRKERNGSLQGWEEKTVTDWAYRSLAEGLDKMTDNKNFLHTLTANISYTEQVIKETLQAGLTMETAWKKGELKAQMEARQRYLEREAQKQDTSTGKQLHKDGVSIFRMQNGFYGINETVNGERSATRRVAQEDLDWYFKDLKGAGPDEVLRRRAALADKYLHVQKPAQKQEQGPQEDKTESYSLPPVTDETKARLTDAKVFQMRDGLNYAVCCKIDGVQQNSKVLNKKDISAFFDHYSGQTPEFRAERQTRVAAFYFHEELQAPRIQQEQAAAQKTAASLEKNGGRKTIETEPRQESADKPKQRNYFKPVFPEVRAQLLGMGHSSNRISIQKAEDGKGYVISCKVGDHELGPKPMKKEDVDIYFRNTKGNGWVIQREFKVAAAADYFSKELAELREKGRKTGIGQSAGTEKTEVAEDKKRNRISDVSVMMMGIKGPHIRCRIDGAQQAAVPISVKDYAALKTQLADKTELAAKYFSSELEQPLEEERNQGLKR